MSRFIGRYEKMFTSYGLSDLKGSEEQKEKAYPKREQAMEIAWNGAVNEDGAFNGDDIAKRAFANAVNRWQEAAWWIQRTSLHGWVGIIKEDIAEAYDEEIEKLDPEN